VINFADLFCGAGGATEGMVLAAKRNKITIGSGVAINHWPVAVETHSSNHPNIKHLCEAIEKVDPCEAVPSGKLDILWASPECTHHSRARGGKPMQNQSRAGASHILTWLDKLYVRNVIIENVPEFEKWGPLDVHGVPLKSGIGKNFHAFIQSLRARSYNVEWRVLNAANFGDATTRERLFVIARRKPHRIVWPEPTHAEKQTTDLFRDIKPWKAVEDCIDWTDLGTPLNDKKLKRFEIDGQEIWLPLAPNTLKRIESGLLEHGGFQFVLGQQTCSKARRTDQPAPTVSTDGAISLVTPLILPTRSDSPARSTKRPLQTITTESRGIGLTTMFLVQTDQTGSNGKCTRDVNKPMGTIVTKQNHALLTAFMLSVAHGNKSDKDNKRRTTPTTKPLGSLTCKGQFGLVNFIVQMNGSSDSHLRTTSHSVKKPLPTQAGTLHHALCSSFLVEYYRTGGTQSVKKPLGTVTTKDRFLLVNAQTSESFELVIYFRLLKPKELAAVHSFPKSYKFSGNKTQIVKQIGNSNPVELTAALSACVMN